MVDWLRARPEVDRRRISLIGQSFGGYLTARAAAYEHRLAGLVTDPGVVDAFVDWRKDLPPSLLRLLAGERRTEFNRIWNSIPKHLPEASPPRPRSSRRSWSSSSPARARRCTAGSTPPAP